MIQRLLGIGLALALTACGGGGDGDGALPGTPEAVSRVEIVQTGLVLTEVGAGKALKAVAYGASGSVIDAPFSWQSTRPEAVSVAADGFATALRANGTALVVATAGGVVSAPLLVAVTMPAVGAVLLTDSQIVGEPVETDASATPSFSNTYRAVLTGVPPPPIGALVVNTESKAVAGRVVATSVAGTQTTVTLALVSIRELFPNLNIDEVIDLTRAPVEFAPEIIAQYDIARTDNTFTFTPKLRVGTSAASEGRVFRAAAAGTRALPPFSKCESSISGFSEGSPLPVTLSAPPLFSVTIAPTLSLLYTGANGLERFVVSAQPTVKVEGGVSVAVAFEGKVECGVDLFTLRIPIGGPLSFVVGGLVPVGVGLEVGGKVTVATLAIGTKVEARAKAQVGFACPGGSDCSFVRSLDEFALTATPTITTPSLANLRVEPSIAAFGTVKAAVGNPFFNSLRFEALKVKAGGKLEGSFAPQATQLLDTAYKSDYKLSFEASAGAGADLSGALSLLGLTGVSAIELKISNDLATSPAGLATGAVTTSIARAGTSTTSDPARFQTGDAVSVTVKLDPATTTFLGLYNVNRVLLVRNTGGQQTEVGRVVAAAGQTEFNFTVVAADAGSVSEFSAFTVTALLPLDLLALEIGNAQTPLLGTVRQTVQLALPMTGPTPMTVTVESRGANGLFVPLPGVNVGMSNIGGLGTCGSFDRLGATTDALGVATFLVTPTNKCLELSFFVSSSSLTQVLATEQVRGFVRFPVFDGDLAIGDDETLALASHLIEITGNLGIGKAVAELPLLKKVGRQLRVGGIRGESVRLPALNSVLSLYVGPGFGVGSSVLTRFEAPLLKSAGNIEFDRNPNLAVLTVGPVKVTQDLNIFRNGFPNFDGFSSGIEVGRLLQIGDNTGFSNQKARDFAARITVLNGSPRISGNTGP